MNGSMRRALLNSKVNYSGYVRSALFHSTPVLDRKRRNHWESFRNHNYSKRARRIRAKQTLLRNVNEYADFLFQKWHNPYDLNEPSSSRGPSWFKKQYSAKDSKKKWGGNRGPSSWGIRDFDFCEDVDVESIFQSRFGGSGFFYWSFVNEDDSQRRSSSNYSNYYQESQKSWSWRRHSEEQYESDFDISNSDERLTLGLSAAGPLKLEDVKNAYRTCALKWHPDRHQGSSKAVAEEKFKHCSAAYQSLCDKLAVN